LIAAGAIARAVAAGDRVSVIVLTNGDYTCARDGWRRQRESIAALQHLHVREEAVTFLGYPDGHLAELGETPLAPVERRAADGSCGRGATTYGARGRGHADEHTARTGAPAPYTAAALVEDLAAALARAGVGATGARLVTTHARDRHPDHAATYRFVRRALEHLPMPYDIELRRVIVHAGGCWPVVPCGTEPYHPTAPMPALPSDFADLPAPSRAPIAPALVPEEKLALIGLHASQLDLPLAHDWLAAFARTDEIFWSEHIADQRRRR
jgi:LmbE family N-acetylglucosaminyl deacetylase